MNETLIDLIREEGPISIARYMELALTHPTLGYYMSSCPIGAQGDFVTAPEITQIFGELVGAWFLNLWETSGCPSAVTFIELGPGRGTLMKDCLRVFALRPAFLKALKIHFVEVSPSLQTLQKQTLKDFSINWFSSLREAFHEGPLYVLANEFLDALPIRQYIKLSQGWAERQIHEHKGRLLWTLSEEFSPFLALKNASLGSIYEESPQTCTFFIELLQRLSKQGGGALLIDYGYSEPRFGNTFQAVKDHEYISVLEAPGKVDLTAHVNFFALTQALKAYPFLTFSLTTQKDFLSSLGIHTRVQRLKQKLSDSQSSLLEKSVYRLLDPSQMGTLFKVLSLKNLSASA